jgi:hypothetical protein
MNKETEDKIVEKMALFHLNQKELDELTENDRRVVHNHFKEMLIIAIKPDILELVEVCDKCDESGEMFDSGHYLETHKNRWITCTKCNGKRIVWKDTPCSTQ